MQRRIQHSTHDECRCAETSEITFDLLDGSDDVLDDSHDGDDDGFDDGDDGLDLGGCVISSIRQDEISA